MTQDNVCELGVDQVSICYGNPDIKCFLCGATNWSGIGLSLKEKNTEELRETQVIHLCPKFCLFLPAFRKEQVATHPTEDPLIINDPTDKELEPSLEEQHHLERLDYQQDLDDECPSAGPQYCLSKKENKMTRKNKSSEPLSDKGRPLKNMTQVNLMPPPKLAQFLKSQQALNEAAAEAHGHVVPMSEPPRRIPVKK